MLQVIYEEEVVGDLMTEETAYSTSKHVPSFC